MHTYIHTYMFFYSSAYRRTEGARFQRAARVCLGHATRATRSIPPSPPRAWTPPRPPRRTYDASCL